jgi:hypothetical protein
MLGKCNSIYSSLKYFILGNLAMITDLPLEALSSDFSACVATVTEASDATVR